MEDSYPHSHRPRELGSDVRRDAVLVLVRRADGGEQGLRWPPLKQLLTAPVRATAGDTGEKKPEISRRFVCKPGWAAQGQLCSF